ncbi:MAG: hypothetical protein ACOC0P_02045, partial [Planctomycetota bacterium]
MRTSRHPGISSRSRLLGGPDWVVEGLLSAEAGVDVVLTSETSPVPGFAEAIAARRSELDRAGITLEAAENDVVLAGLLRAGQLAARRTVAMFDMRGFRNAFDTLYEASHIPVRSTGGGVAVLCEPRWRIVPLLPSSQADTGSGSGRSSQPRRATASPSDPARRGATNAAASARMSINSATPIRSAEDSARRVAELLQRGALGRSAESGSGDGGGGITAAPGAVTPSSASASAGAGETARRFGSLTDDGPRGGLRESGSMGSPFNSERLPAADPRDLAAYLGMTMLEPSSPEEIRQYVNEALRLSRASRRLVLMWLPPSLIEGGETPHAVTDPTIRSVARTVDALGSRPASVHPVHRESRLRMLDRIVNAPGPGEVVPLAFITIGTTFTALRHALNMLELTGRVPILKLAYTNPVDVRSVEQMLARSRRVVVIEPGRPLIERKVLAIAQSMALAGQQPAEVFGRWLPVEVPNSLGSGRIFPARTRQPEGDDSRDGENEGRGIARSTSHIEHPELEHTRGQRTRDRVPLIAGTALALPEPDLPQDAQHHDDLLELHPSSLALRLGPLLRRVVPVMRQQVADRLEEQRHNVDVVRQHWPDLARSLTEFRDERRNDAMARRRQDLIHVIVHHSIRVLTQELAESTASRPALKLRAETIDDTGLDPGPDERVLVSLERRRLPGVGRAAITHALRRRLNITFVVEPDAPGLGGSGVSVTEAEAIVRSLFATTVTGRPMVGVVDPADGLLLHNTLRRALLSPRLAVVIVDNPNPAMRRNVAGEPEEWAKLGYVPREVRIRPTSGVPGVAQEWLVRSGWNAASDLDGVHGPRIDLPEPSDPRATPLDGWEGFEEFRVYREQPPPESAAWMQGLFVPTPTPEHGNQPHWRVHVAGPLNDQFVRTMTVLRQVGQRMGYRVQWIHGRDTGGAFGQVVFTRPRPSEPAPPVTARIPFGAADLIIALGPETLHAAIDPVGGHAVASPGRTCMVLDLSGGVSIASESGWGRPRQFVVPGSLNRIIPPAQRVVL